MRRAARVGPCAWSARFVVDAEAELAGARVHVVHGEFDGLGEPVPLPAVVGASWGDQSDAIDWGADAFHDGARQTACAVRCAARPTCVAWDEDASSRSPACRLFASLNPARLDRNATSKRAAGASPRRPGAHHKKGEIGNLEQVRH